MTLRQLLALLALLFPLPFVSGCFGYHRGAMPGEPRAATYAEVDGARVRYVDTGGEGSPVVLVHGFASSLETWTTVLPVLARSHRVIALDMKGFGWTDRPEGDYSPDAQARMLLKLLDQRGVERADFVGHSWGASIVLAAALAAPERVRRVALYDAYVYEEQVPVFFHWARVDGVGEALFAMYYKERSDERISLAFYDKRYVTEALVEDVERSLERPGTLAAALAAVRGLRYTAMQARYRKISQPALLLWGRDDKVTPIAFGERLAAELPSARLVIYPRCGHFPMLEAMSASNAELDAFLAEEKRP